MKNEIPDIPYHYEWGISEIYVNALFNHIKQEILHTCDEGKPKMLGGFLRDCHHIGAKFLCFGNHNQLIRFCCDIY